MLERRVGIPKHTLKSMRSVDHTSVGTFLDELDVDLMGVDGTLLGVVSGSDGSQVSGNSSSMNLLGNCLESLSLCHHDVNLLGVSLGLKVTAASSSESTVSTSNSTGPETMGSGLESLGFTNITVVFDVDSFLSSLGLHVKGIHGSSMSQSSSSDTGGNLLLFNSKSPGSVVLGERSLGSDHSSLSDGSLLLPHEVDVDSVGTVLSLDVRSSDVVFVSTGERFPGVNVLESSLEARTLDSFGRDGNGEGNDGEAEFH